MPAALVIVRSSLNGLVDAYISHCRLEDVLVVFRVWAHDASFDFASDISLTVGGGGPVRLAPGFIGVSSVVLVVLKFLKAVRRRSLDGGGGRGGVYTDSCWEDMLVNVSGEFQVCHNLQSLMFICFRLYKSKNDWQWSICKRLVEWHQQRWWLKWKRD